jgi:O-6-methylguanine DNA methyltransferase
MAGAEPHQIVSLWTREIHNTWFGLAEFDYALVATSVAAAQDEALHSLIKCLPSHAPYIQGHGESIFADETARMLAAIESGDESNKRFSIAKRFIPEPAASVFRLAASIPLGYACSYGRIAAKAGTIAREVGRLMANNPLYPLVPCHRVVGSDYSLVGYRGKSSGPDLDDKLARLKAEARGFRDDHALTEAEGLVVFPVERVIERAERRRSLLIRQLSLL